MTDIASPAAPVRIDSPTRRIVKEFLEDPVAVIGLILFILIALIALAAPWIAPQNPYDLAQLDIMDGALPPGEASFGTGMTYWLGPDQQGRDMLSAIMYGLRTSLTVGIMSGVVAIIIGMAVGLSAAYFGGRVDTLIMRVVDIQLSFPAILIALMADWARFNLGHADVVAEDVDKPAPAGGKADD